MSSKHTIVPEELLRERAWIPDDLLPEVLKWLPVSTVDFVPTRVQGGVREFCLGFRTEQPFQNTWFVTGGRKNFGETTLGALHRQAKRELGLDVGLPGVVARFVAVLDVINPASSPDGGPVARPLWHSNWLFHEIVLDEGVEPVACAENKVIRWFTHIHPDFPDPVKDALRLLGFPETDESAGE